MNKKIKLLLYYFDFTGVTPQFRILNYDSYRSIFSSILSILIILFSINFSIISFLDYLKFNNPSVSYMKRVDFESNSTFLLKDTLFMFKALGFTFGSEVKFNYLGYYFFDDYQTIELNLEVCEIGKNINVKFKDLLIKNLNTSINTYYCISAEHGNLPLYYNPAKINEISYLSIEIYFNSTENNFDDEDSLYLYRFELITENNIIDHYNKNNPLRISPYFFKSEIYPSSIFLSVDYKYEYIRYETDYGYFFQNPKYLTAAGLSDVYYDVYYYQNNVEKDVNNLIGTITYKQSERNYSHYKRSYQKVQSLLADIMSIINILIGVSKLISSILLQKKMSKDIIKSLINESNNNIENKNHSLIETNYKEKKIFKDIRERAVNSERNNINKELFEKSNIKDKSNNILNNKLLFEKKETKRNVRKKQKENILNNINFLDVIKSYFCSKTKKLKLINICHDLVMKELCLDRFLYRLYELEKLFSLLSKEEHFQLKLKKDKKLNDITHYISKIVKEEKKKVKKKNKNIEKI